MARRSQHIGEYQSLEVPAPLRYQYLDSDGVAVDITGYTATVYVQPPKNGAEVTGTAALAVAATGHVDWTWTTAMTDEAGKWSAVIWITDGTTTYASDQLQWSVFDGPGPA